MSRRFLFTTSLPLELIKFSTRETILVAMICSIAVFKCKSTSICERFALPIDLFTHRCKYGRNLNMLKHNICISVYQKITLRKRYAVCMSWVLGMWCEKVIRIQVRYARIQQGVISMWLFWSIICGHWITSEWTHTTSRHLKKNDWTNRTTNNEQWILLPSVISRTMMSSKQYT